MSGPREPGAASCREAAGRRVPGSRTRRCTSLGPSKCHQAAAGGKAGCSGGLAGKGGSPPSIRKRPGRRPDTGEPAAPRGRGQGSRDVHSASPSAKAVLGLQLCALQPREGGYSALGFLPGTCSDTWVSLRPRGDISRAQGQPAAACQHRPCADVGKTGKKQEHWKKSLAQIHSSRAEGGRPGPKGARQDKCPLRACTAPGKGRTVPESPAPRGASRSPAAAAARLYVIRFPQTQGTARRNLCRAAWKENSPALELCRIMFHSEPLAVWVAPALTLEDVGWAKRQHEKGLRSRAGEGRPPPNILILLLLKHLKELPLLSPSRSPTVSLLLCQAKGLAKGFKQGEVRSISPCSHAPIAPG